MVSFSFDLHSAAVFDSHMPCHVRFVLCLEHSVLKEISQGHDRARHGHWHGHGLACHGMCELASACWRPVRLRLLPAITRSSTTVVIRNIPISNLNAGGQCENKQHLLKLIILVQEHECFTISSTKITITI
jgi:hypothetical protein